MKHIALFMLMLLSSVLLSAGATLSIVFIQLVSGMSIDLPLTLAVAGVIALACLVAMRLFYDVAGGAKQVPLPVTAPVVEAPPGVPQSLQGPFVIVQFYETTDAPVSGARVQSTDPSTLVLPRARTKPMGNPMQAEMDIQGGICYVWDVTTTPVRAVTVGHRIVRYTLAPSNSEQITMDNTLDMQVPDKYQHVPEPMQGERNT